MANLNNSLAFKGFVYRYDGNDKVDPNKLTESYETTVLRRLYQEGLVDSLELTPRDPNSLTATTADGKNITISANNGDIPSLTITNPTGELKIMANYSTLPKLNDLVKNVVKLILDRIEKLRDKIPPVEEFLPRTNIS